MVRNANKLAYVNKLTYIKKFTYVLLMILIFTLLCGFDENQQKVIDDAYLFSESELEELEEKAISLAKEVELDLIIYTNYNGVSEWDMKEFADSYYDDNGFGYDDGCSGVLLVIDMESRQVYICTTGIAIWYIDDGDIEDILDDVQPKLTDGEYFDACESFLEDVHEIAYQFIENDEEGIDVWKDNSYTEYEDFYYDFVVNNKDVDYHMEQFSLAKWLIYNPLQCAIVSILISGIIVLILSYRGKSKMTANGNTYMDRNAYKIHRRDDYYIRTTTTSYKIERSSGGGGGGGGSFSGGHGGGGRGF